MSTSNKIPTPLELAVDEQYAAAGYSNDTGGKSMTKVDMALLGVLRDRIVGSPGEMKERAVSRATMVELLFPDLAGPAAWGQQSDPVFAEQVWKRINSDLWGECRVDYKARLARLVESTLGIGNTLIRGRVSTPDVIEVVAITTDAELAYAGVTGVDIKALAAKYETSEGNLAMLMRQYPEQAKKFKGKYTRATKTITANVHQRVALLAAEAEADEADES
jgi:hypothetical protein